MSKFDEKNIIESLKQFSEIPSEKCWESIAQNLPPISPAPTNANIDPTITQQISQFFSTVAGKIIALATTAVVATSIGALYHFSNIEESAEKINNNLQIVEISDSVNFDNDSDLVSTAIVKNEIDNKEIKNEILEAEPISNKIIDVVDIQTTIPEKTVSIQPVNNDKISENTTALSSKKVSDNSKKEDVEKIEINETVSATQVEEQEPEYIDNSESEMITKSEIAKSNKIEKLDISDIVVPNVFTPNNDGYNDYLVFKNLYKYPQNRLIVVNAKGNIVFERYQYDNSWDAPNVPDGSYFFILEISNGALSSTIQGVLQILR